MSKPSLAAEIEEEISDSAVVEEKHVPDCAAEMARARAIATEARRYLDRTGDEPGAVRMFGEAIAIIARQATARRFAELRKVAQQATAARESEGADEERKETIH